MKPNLLSAADQRTLAVLNAYGSNPAHWPPDERTRTLDCIARSPQLQHYQAEIARLDVCIANAQETSLDQIGMPARLQERILAQLPAQTSQHAASSSSDSGWRKYLAWLIAPRLAIAYASLILLAIVLLLPHSSPPGKPALASNEFEAWAWYDITGQELPTPGMPASLTLMDLVDPDVTEDGG